MKSNHALSAYESEPIEPISGTEGAQLTHKFAARLRSKRRTPAERKANAYLIAAAPELLEALRRLSDATAAHLQGPPHVSLTNDLTDAILKSHAAISKAEGQ